MICANAQVMRLSEAMSRLALEGMFVRPDEDSNAFDGGLFNESSLKAVFDPAIRKAYIDEDTLVVIAEPVQIDAEWRTFIVDGQVVAASSYRKDGAGNIDLYVPHRVIDLAFGAAELWSPAPVFCLDIALTGQRYGIVEANCFNASRFYGADASAILESVSSLVNETYAQASVNEPNRTLT